MPATNVETLTNPRDSLPNVYTNVTARELDFVTRFATNWDALRTILGITRPIKKTPGTRLTSYTATVALENGNVGPGEVIPYSKSTITKATEADLEIEKYAKAVPIEDVVKYEKDIENYKNAFLTGVNQNTDDYTKIKYTYEYIIKNTEYDVDSVQNQNILSVFVYGRSVCQGYAKAFQYLSEELGIQSTLVVGYVGANEGHAWNMVKCNGQYYYIDCTWGDSSYLENSMSLSTGGINYDYLNITTSELELTHVIDNFTPLPPCNSVTDNYYVKEGLYFEGIDLVQLDNAFMNAKFQGRDSVELKCSSKEVYDKLGEYLLDDNHIFDYMSSDKESIKFMQNKDLNIYSFPLR